jgi:hypothetical protein
MRHIISIALVLALAACADSRTKCLNRAAAELTAIDAEIVDIEVALARGYRVKEGSRVTAGFAVCSSNDPLHLCLGTERQISERRLTIDPAMERARLRTLQAHRPEAAAAAAQAQAQCPAP